jgi:hypothetical protein
MRSWLSRLFPGRKQQDPEIVRVQVPLDRLMQKMQEPKDLRLVISSDGSFTAHCKKCAVTVKTAEKDGLIWYVCLKCNRVSFNPVGNMERDIELAQRHGGTFEYEIFYFRDLPPGLKPPDM